MRWCSRDDTALTSESGDRYARQKATGLGVDTLSDRISKELDASERRFAEIEL